MNIDRLHLVNNLLSNFNYLKTDFTVITVNIGGVINFLENMFAASFLILLYFFLGKKINYLILKLKKTPITIFLNIATGYILFNSGIGLLGIFSKLNLSFLMAFLLIILFFIFPSVTRLKETIEELNVYKEFFKNLVKKETFLTIAILSFLLIAFLRIIPPDIREDQYHTDLASRYVKNYTTMLLPKDPLPVITIPQLGEMSYVTMDMIGFPGSSRFINFIFYLFSVLLLVKITNEKRANLFSALLFASAPIVISLTSTSYVDFQWIFLWLLTIVVFTRKSEGKSSVKISAFLYGGVLATKIWTIAFFPVFFAFIFFVEKKERLKQVISFSWVSLAIPFIWYVRSFILIGNPLFPAFSEGGRGVSLISKLLYHVGFNDGLNISVFSVFSPIFFLTLLFCIFERKKMISEFGKNKFLLFFFLLSVEYIFIRYGFGRYLLGWYLVFILIMGAAAKNLFEGQKIYKCLFILFYFSMFLYYFFNTIFILPYGLGWADKNKYLTRVLSRDNSSYYDFDHYFDKFISKKDLVATYGIYGYRYANFSYIDIGYIFSGKNKTLDELKDKGVTKLFIKGLDIKTFCKNLHINGCTPEKYILLSFYEPAPRYLYKIN